MKTILSSRRHRYLTKFCIFLVTVALILAVVGCEGDGEPKFDLTMAVTPAGVGTATDLTNASPYEEGTDVSVEAVADPGYHFVSWTAPAGGFTNANAAQTTFTMPAQDVIVTANFAEEQPSFAGGNGTAEDPYQIADWYHLDNVRNYLSSYFILMNDLDSNSAGYTELASPTANAGKGWEPIGWQPIGIWEYAVSIGTFDGQGYEIRDLFINRPDESYVGLFGCVHEGGVIKDIGVVNADVTGGYEYVGGLVGRNYESTVSNSYATGSVTGSWKVGGLVGENEGGVVSDSYAAGSVAGNWTVGGLVGGNYGTVSNSYSTGSVTGESLVGGLMGENARQIVGGQEGDNTGNVIHSYSTGSVTGSSEVGGLVGWNSYYGTVSNSYSSGNVTGDQCVGGLVGDNDQGSTVSNSYSTGSVTGGEYVGGLVGLNYESTVSDSYATGNINGDSLVGGLVGRTRGTVSNSYSTGSVTGSTQVGGLVGYNEHWGTVSNSYSTGIVIGNEDVGGLVGENDGSVDNSFWDTETSGQATSDGGTGKTTTEMQNITTFSGAGWNIIEVVDPATPNPAYIWNIPTTPPDYPFLSWEPN